jgi:hypothetical protein
LGSAADGGSVALKKRLGRGEDGVDVANGDSHRWHELLHTEEGFDRDFSKVDIHAQEEGTEWRLTDRRREAVPRRWTISWVAPLPAMATDNEFFFFCEKTDNEFGGAVV